MRENDSGRDEVGGDRTNNLGNEWGKCPNLNLIHHTTDILIKKYMRPYQRHNLRKPTDLKNFRWTT